jgi:hypothetical protein
VPPTGSSALHSRARHVVKTKAELSVVLVSGHIWPAVPSRAHTPVFHREAPYRGQAIGMPARSRTHGRAWTPPLAGPMLTVGLRPKALPFRPRHSLACLAQSFAIVCVPRVLSPSSPLWPNHLRSPTRGCTKPPQHFAV